MKTLLRIFVTLSLMLAPAAPRLHAECPQAYDWSTVDEKPEFPGGDRAMLSFINATRCYPEDCMHANVQGRVICSFLVKADGSIHGVKVVRGVHESLNREAVRIISQMPRWQPAKRNGEAIPVYYLLAIPFRLY